MKFQLSRVTPNDLDELIALQFHAFSGLDFHDALFGPNTPAMRLRAKKGILKDMAEDAADVWLKITNGDTGRIVCGANWKVYPTYVSSTSEGKHGLSVDWYEGEEKEMAEFLVKDFTERRRGYCKEAHVVLSILFTDPEYQRLGAGSMMVKWGCDLADHLFLPVWVEGSEKGHELYLQNGFEDVENVNTQTKKWVSHYYMMRRPRKVSMVEGKSLSIIP